MNDAVERKKPDEVIAEILGRWSVSDLIEQTDEALTAADERFYKSGDMEIIETGQQGAIKFWKIRSGGNVYECRRFNHYCFCSCTGFFFSKKVCKHLAATARVLCQRCREVSATRGKYCHGCFTIMHPFGVKDAAQSEWREIGSRSKQQEKL